MGGVEVKLHGLDKVFTGIIKLRERLNRNVLGKVASLWYYLTRIFHQSIGPRVGNFVEELISYWIEQGDIYNLKASPFRAGMAMAYKPSRALVLEGLYACG
jgi:hypothetical protein